MIRVQHIHAIRILQLKSFEYLQPYHRLLEKNINTSWTNVTNIKVNIDKTFTMPSGALLTLSLGKLILNSQCKEVAK